VFDTIVRVANTERFDLVIMGVSETFRLASAFGSDLVQRVASVSQCPVIAVTGAIIEPDTTELRA
jgi:nucleotide-binding universal stress UspA family protein